MPATANDTDPRGSLQRNQFTGRPQHRTQGAGHRGTCDRIAGPSSKEGHAKGRVLVSSFSREELVEMGRLDTGDKARALIDTPLKDDIEFAAKLGAFSVHPSVEHVDRQFIKGSHTRGLKVYVYTVDRSEDISGCFSSGRTVFSLTFPERVLEKSRAAGYGHRMEMSARCRQDFLLDFVSEEPGHGEGERNDGHGG